MYKNAIIHPVNLAKCVQVTVWHLRAKNLSWLYPPPHFIRQTKYSDLTDAKSQPRRRWTYPEFDPATKQLQSEWRIAPMTHSYIILLSWPQDDLQHFALPGVPEIARYVRGDLCMLPNQIFFICAEVLWAGLCVHVCALNSAILNCSTPKPPARREAWIAWITKLHTDTTGNNLLDQKSLNIFLASTASPVTALFVMRRKKSNRVFGKERERCLSACLIMSSPCWGWSVWLAWRGVQTWVQTATERWTTRPLERRRRRRACRQQRGTVENTCHTFASRTVQGRRRHPHRVKNNLGTVQSFVKSRDKNGRWTAVHIIYHWSWRWQGYFPFCFNLKGSICCIFKYSDFLHILFFIFNLNQWSYYKN